MLDNEDNMKKKKSDDISENEEKEDKNDSNNDSNESDTIIIEKRKSYRTDDDNKKKKISSDEESEDDNKKKKISSDEESEENLKKKKKSSDEESNESEENDKKKKKKINSDDESENNNKKKKISSDDESEENIIKKKKKRIKSSDEESDESEGNIKKKKINKSSDDESEENIKKKKKKISSDDEFDVDSNTDSRNENEKSSDENENYQKKRNKKNNFQVNKNKIKTFEKKVSKIIEDYKSLNKSKTPESIKKILSHLENNLFEFNISQSDKIFGDFTLIFKTGIIIEKILSQSPLIIENLPNLQTAVLERCNDLFNYNPTINLSEDTCNTFTGDDDKNLTGFSNGFRVIATSSELAIRNLSDAARSRFSIIYCNSYTFEERDLLIQNFYKETPKEFYDFLKKYKENFQKDLSFSYITKILNILKLIDEKIKDKIVNRLNNLCIAIHLSLKFLMNNPKKKEIFKSIINNIVSDFYPEKKKNNKEEVEDKIPFIIDDDSGELRSKWSNLVIKSKYLKEKKNNLAFIKPFNKLLEHIHASIALHYPLIIEGGTGKGKKSAIYYMANILGYDIVYFNISNATTVEDLFCKKMPVEEKGNMTFKEIRSLFLDAIDFNTEKKQNIIILDNLQLANSNILESLVPVFDTKKSSLLVQGEIISKGSYNIIGIIDSSMESKNVNDLIPDSIKHSTIFYHNSQYLKRKYCQKVIEKMFGNEYNKEENL